MGSSSLSLELCLVPELEDRKNKSVCIFLIEEAVVVLSYMVTVAKCGGAGTWIWRNGLLVRVKSRIEVLTKKVDSFNSSIERAGNADSPYLKDMMDLNTELTGYFSSLTDN